MKNAKQKAIKRETRHKRIRSKVSGTAECPRLSVYKSNTAVYAQLIDDVSRTTLAAFTSSQLKGGSVLERARKTGAGIAKIAKEKGIEKVVFDRGGFIYAGKIKEVADGAREGGLKF